MSSEIANINERYRTAEYTAGQHERIKDARTLLAAGYVIERAFLASAPIALGDGDASEKRLLADELGKWRKIDAGITGPYVYFPETNKTDVFAPAATIAYWQLQSAE